MTWNTVGHDWAVTLLRQGLAGGRSAHATLFCGPPQIGKTTLALELAQALNCPQPDPPCGHCPSCLKTARRAHPDVQLIVGKGAGEAIQIDQIRALQREAVLAPYEGRYRVLILRHIDRATTEAANCLLKTLEEPPAHVVLALTAVQPELLPSTVVSRCQRLDLRPVAQVIVEAALRERECPAPQAHLLAQLSGGRVGWAIAASHDDSTLRQRQQDLDQLFALLSADRVSRLDFAWKISRDPTTARRQIDMWTAWYRDLLLWQGESRIHVANVDKTDALDALAQQTPVRHAWATLKALRETADQLEANVNPRLALEGLVLKLPYHRLSRPDGA